MWCVQARAGPTSYCTVRRVSGVVECDDRSQVSHLSGQWPNIHTMIHCNNKYST
jgi:hypothetical protein